HQLSRYIMTLKIQVQLYYRFLIVLSLLFYAASELKAQNFVKQHYNKKEVRIPMRDGVKLYTVIYTPKDSTRKYPIMMERTPYSAGPYGEGNYARSLGPNENLMKSGYIFVYQDVRGRYMSDGDFREVTPHDPTRKGIDESSDTYDTIEWLLANIRNTNGRVGIWGISYPGFYASAALPSAHPAIKAVSPQAPVTDEFAGDDVNHKGAFFLLDNFMFSNYFDKPRKGPVEDYGGSVFDLTHKDAYDFFLNIGPLKNTLKPEYFGNTHGIYKEYLAHDTYDSYWKQRNIRIHLKNIKPATLVVGGWFDAEDLFGALETYRAIETQSEGNSNSLIMGPWTHGAWARGNFDKYASYDLGSNTSQFYRDSVETPFFSYHLKDSGSVPTHEAIIFETGSNRWRRYQQWPSEDVNRTSFYLAADGKLANRKGNGKEYTKYVSDPADPVPYTAAKTPRRNNNYMGEDQAFAAMRNDVVEFVSTPLTKNLVVSGKIIADLKVSTTGTDADFIVKLIDVIPATDGKPEIQRLVRAEVIRGKFRNSLEKPETFIPGKITTVRFELPDAAHCFKEGHKMMVQVQSSWFPLVDRNPQKFMHILDADEKDYQPATIRIYDHSKIELDIKTDN
ncbi:MAG TPA: CocE/NonD family hydrolase, partial [Chitinophagaceae bacterium]|nr:CocE/NonD family hydrolase [Chitinophagaceae bacterium]